jgi:hypothetical protein
MCTPRTVVDRHPACLYDHNNIDAMLLAKGTVEKAMDSQYGLVLAAHA